MSNITFDEIMDFYPRHNRSVFDELKMECQKGSLIPFVGAGLSVFCGYRSWPSVLKELAGFVYSHEIQTQIEHLIDEGDLLQAAQMIYDHYSRMMKELSKIVGYEKIKDCDENVLYASAVYVLPYLFKENLVMTTNFDRVLEEVYERHRAKFGRVINPYEPDILAQVRQGNSHCLFKLHGDIGPDTHDIEKLVFTKAQYDKAYAGNSALVEELSKWFQSKRLLFLGCSLSMDKTMEVLQMAMEKNTALNHYAVLSCKEEDMERRIDEMGKLGISAVFYPDGKHEAVRVILERVLEEINQESYAELCRKAGSSSADYSNKNRFMYNSEYFAFTGREGEMDCLKDFCQSDENVSWWAVTGPGGIGKSRLVHEFTKSMRDDGWNIQWLTPRDYQSLDHIVLPVDRCIVVADDAQEHFQAVGNWLNSKLNDYRSEKLRILLLERDGLNLESAQWTERLVEESPYDDTIKSKCYNKEFLQLKPLTEDILKTIMINFAEASGKPLPNSDYVQRLLQVLQKLDGSLLRPIYALAIVDAWCSGKDPYRWEKTQVLDALVTRELDFYYKRLKGMGKGVSNAIRAEFEKLVAWACIVPFVPLESISEEKLPKLSKKAFELDMEISELLKQMGIAKKIRLTLQNENDEESGERITKVLDAVVFDCPDLIKEHFVLQRVLIKQNTELLFSDNWDNSPMRLSFIRRILRDYPEKLDGKEWFWEFFFEGNPEESYQAWIYSNVLFGITVQLPRIKEKALERLGAIQELYNKDERIAVEYGKCLFNQTVKQSERNCLEAVQSLEKLHEQFPEHEEILSMYAKGLVNLTAEQQLDDCNSSVQRLKFLSDKCTDNDLITLNYAEGLVNLATLQEINDRVQSVQIIEELYKLNQMNERLAYTYAMAVDRLAVVQDIGDCIHSVRRLKKLFRQFRESKDIQFAYARGLVSLMYKQELIDCKQSYQELAELYNQSKTESNEDIAETYCCGLLNLSFKQESVIDVMETLDCVKSVLMQHPDNQYIQLMYAETWFNITLKQTSDELKKTVIELRKYLQKNTRIREEFQKELDEYLMEHPDHTERYEPLRL